MDAITDPFWEALAEGRFVIPVCGECDEAFFPPAAVCPRCHADSVTWTESDATGELYAFTRQHRTAPGFDSPIVLGIVTLTEGPRLLARIDADVEDLSIGTTVRLVPRPAGDGIDRGRLADRPYFAARLVDA